MNIYIVLGMVMIALAIVFVVHMVVLLLNKGKDDNYYGPMA